MRVLKFVLYEFATKKATSFLFTIFLNIFLHIFIGEKAVCLFMLRSNQLASVTEGFFLWQKLLWVARKNSLTEIVYLWQKCIYLWQKCIYLTETLTEICLCDGNLFSKEIFFSIINLCPKETCFWDIYFFSVKQIGFCQGKSLGFYTWFPRKNFCDN